MWGAFHGRKLCLADGRCNKQFFFFHFWKETSHNTAIKKLGWYEQGQNITYTAVKISCLVSSYTFCMWTLSPFTALALLIPNTHCSSLLVPISKPVDEIALVWYKFKDFQLCFCPFQKYKRHRFVPTFCHFITTITWPGKKSAIDV